MSPAYLHSLHLAADVSKKKSSRATLLANGIPASAVTSSSLMTSLPKCHSLILAEPQMTLRWIRQSFIRAPRPCASRSQSPVIPGGSTDGGTTKPSDAGTNVDDAGSTDAAVAVLESLELTPACAAAPRPPVRRGSSGARTRRRRRATSGWSTASTTTASTARCSTGS